MKNLNFNTDRNLTIEYFKRQTYTVMDRKIISAVKIKDPLKMKSYFESEQEANRYKEEHQLFGRVPEIDRVGRWMLVFPIKGHLSVHDHKHAEFKTSQVENKK